MDFGLTEEQQSWQNTVRKFAAKELLPVAAAVDEAEEFPWENFHKMAKQGFTGMMVPEEYGGIGGDAKFFVIAMEEIARICASSCDILAATLGLAGRLLCRQGTEQQKRKYLSPLAKGQKIGAFALTEPDAGSDVAAIQTTAKRQGDHYLLNGSKVFITNGTVAETTIVFATTDRSLGPKGITAFIVEKDFPGYSVGNKPHKMGMRGAPNAEIFFEDCPVPSENMVNEEGKGMRVALEAIDEGRLGIASQAVGIAQAAYETSVRYSKQRVQFGQQISSFQMIQSILADMATRVSAARFLVYNAADQCDKGLPITKAGAMAKLFASETAMWVTTKGIQVHGGYGYMKEYPLERYFRDAKLTEIYEGTSEIQRIVIARSVLAEFN